MFEDGKPAHLTIAKAGEAFDRRAFVGAASIALASVALAGCASGQEDAADSRGQTDASEREAPGNSENAGALPPAEPNPESEFGVDLHVNMATIDEFIDTPGVVLRDMRLVQDPARYEEIGGNSELSLAIAGFRVVPYPYIGTLAPLPVSGAYEGERLFDVEWDSEGDGLNVLSATPRYTQSEQVLDELFPRDSPIFLMCGGAGYAAMTKALLVFLGWDASLLYNVGGAWDYNGTRAVQLVSYANADHPEYYFWRTDIVYFDFGLFTPRQDL